MKVSIEITLAPLQNDYEKVIKDFIRDLRTSPFTVQENPLSTQIYGEFAPMMEFLTLSIARSFDPLQAGMIQLKIVKSDRSNYLPFD